MLQLCHLCIIVIEEISVGQNWRSLNLKKIDDLILQQNILYTFSIVGYY